MFNDQPISRKLAVVTLGATILALMLACTGFSIYERASFRATTVGQLTTLADTLGANAAASLTFRDKKTGKEILSALRAERQVTAASLYDDQGDSFAEYRRSDLPAGFVLPPRPPEGAHFESRSLTLVRRVLMGKTLVPSPFCPI
jgi:Periplasmic sensor domain